MELASFLAEPIHCRSIYTSQDWVARFQKRWEGESFDIEINNFECTYNNNSQNDTRIAQGANLERKSKSAGRGRIFKIFSIIGIDNDMYYLSQL